MLDQTLNIGGSSASTAAGRAAVRPDAAGAAAGALAGAVISKAPTTSELLQDLQEEMSFAHAERRESEDSVEETVEDRRRHMHRTLVHRVRETFADDNRPRQQKTAALRDKLRHGDIRSQDALLAALEDATPDRGEALALLLDIGDAPADLPASARELVARGIETFTGTHAAAIAASVNTLAAARDTAQDTGLETAHLQAAYQEAVTDYQGILPALVTLTDKLGPANFEHGRSFLFRAADADLASERQASVQPERLKRILAELQGVKVFNSIRARAGELMERHAGRNPAVAGFGRDGLTSHLLHVATDPGALQTRILPPMDDRPPQDRLLFLQDLRNTVRNLPDYLYRVRDEKARTVFPIQTAIDHLVFDEGA